MDTECFALPLRSGAGRRVDRAPAAPCDAEPTGRLRGLRDGKEGEDRLLCPLPVHAVAEPGRAEDGIFGSQELTGPGAIIAGIRPPMSSKKEQDLRTAGEAHATDPTREGHLAVARGDRRVQAAHDTQWIEASQVQRPLTLVWRAAVSRTTIAWCGALGRVVNIDKPDGVGVSGRQLSGAQLHTHTG